MIFKSEIQITAEDTEQVGKGQAEQLAVEAAVEGSVDKMKMALLAHPLVREYELVEKLVPELLEANKVYLPQFNL